MWHVLEIMNALEGAGATTNAKLVSKQLPPMLAAQASSVTALEMERRKGRRVDAADVAAPRRARHAQRAASKTDMVEELEDHHAPYPSRRSHIRPHCPVAAGHLQLVRPRRQRHDRRRRAGGADEETRLGLAQNPPPTRYSPHTGADEEARVPASGRRSRSSTSRATSTPTASSSSASSASSSRRSKRAASTAEATRRPSPRRSTSSRARRTATSAPKTSR